MFNYQIHSIETAPEKSKPLLELFTHAIGFVPNLAGAIANSPVLANSLLGVFKNVHGGSFTEAEVQVLLLTNAVTNSSSWPVAFHTALGLNPSFSTGGVGDPGSRSRTTSWSKGLPHKSDVLALTQKLSAGADARWRLGRQGEVQLFEQESVIGFRMGVAA